METKILTLHPQGKAGVNIDKPKYDQIRGAIVDSLNAHGVMSFKELTAAVQSALKGRFQGSIPWYVTTVKLDLEARGVIERIPGKKPQQLQLIQ